MKSTRPELFPAGLYGVAFHYGRIAVLHELEFEISAGELVALIGANGAGKTTLFSVLLGLAQPSSGERRFAGKLVSEVDEPYRAAIAYLGHHPQVYLRLTARENIVFFSQLRGCEGLSRSEIAAHLAAVDLGHAADRLAATYSRGMLQRLALAIALSKRADLLILDEPFTALDRRGRADLANLLRRERDRGAAVLFASHDIDAIAGVADRAVLLEDGRIRAHAVRRGSLPVCADDAASPDCEIEFRTRLAEMSGGTRSQRGPEVGA